jgi:hypothetical protein
VAGDAALRSEGIASVGQHGGAIAGSQGDEAGASAAPRVKKKPRRGKKLNYKPELESPAPEHGGETSLPGVASDAAANEAGLEAEGKQMSGPEVAGSLRPIGEATEAAGARLPRGPYVRTQSGSPPQSASEAGLEAEGAQRAGALDADLRFHFKALAEVLAAKEDTEENKTEEEASATPRVKKKPGWIPLGF